MNTKVLNFAEALKKAKNKTKQNKTKNEQPKKDRTNKLSTSFPNGIFKYKLVS